MQSSMLVGIRNHCSTSVAESNQTPPVVKFVDEAGGPAVLGDPVQEQGQLIGVDGAVPPGPGVGALTSSASIRARRMMV